MTKTEKITVIKNINPPVRLTGKESSADLDAIIRERNGVEPAETTGEEPTVEKPKKKASSAVHFVMADGRKRSFTETDHGDAFADVANEFHETNKLRIKSRVDE